MQKILRKRIVRDFKANLPRYLALALLIVLSMYLVVSMIGAAETIIRGSEEADEAQQVEDGEFSLFVPMKESEFAELTEKGITLEKMFFMDYSYEDSKTLRVFANREQINTVALKEGTLPVAEDEIVIERRFAEVNEIIPGDKIDLGGRSFTVSGIGTAPDYDNVMKSLGDTKVGSCQTTKNVRRILPSKH